MRTIPFKEPAFGYFPRAAFTAEVGKRMVEWGTNLALFAPRRYGKTTWILLELQSFAEVWNVDFAYINLWSDRSDPVGTLATGLEIAAGLRPDDRNTRVIQRDSSANVFGFNARQGYPTVTTEIAVRVKAAMGALAKLERRTLLVMDEFQAIAEADQDRVAISAFRTALEHHGDQIVALFAGSVRSALIRLFRSRCEPLLEQATLIELPALGEDFARDRAAGLRERARTDLSEREVLDAFVTLGRSPLLLNEALTELAVRADLNLDAAVAEAIETRGSADYGAQMAGLPDLDRDLLARIATGKRLDSDIEDLALPDWTVEKRRMPRAQAAIKRLRRDGLIEERLDHHAGWAITDPLLQKWVRRLAGLSCSARSESESNDALQESAAKLSVRRLVR